MDKRIQAARRAAPLFIRDDVGQEAALKLLLTGRVQTTWLIADMMRVWGMYRRNGQRTQRLGDWDLSRDRRREQMASLAERKRRLKRDYKRRQRCG